MGISALSWRDSIDRLKEGCLIFPWNSRVRVFQGLLHISSDPLIKYSLREPKALFSPLTASDKCVLVFNFVGDVRFEIAGVSCGCGMTRRSRVTKFRCRIANRLNARDLCAPKFSLMMSQIDTRYG